LHGFVLARGRQVKQEQTEGTEGLILFHLDLTFRLSRGLPELAALGDPTRVRASGHTFREFMPLDWAEWRTIAPAHAP